MAPFRHRFGLMLIAGAAIVLAMHGPARAAPQHLAATYPSVAAPQCRVDLGAGAVALSDSLRPFPLALDALRAFYGSSSACVWNDADAKTLMMTLAEVPDHGLDPRRFRLEQALHRSGEADPRAAAERDLLLTDAALAFARTMMQGAIDPATIEDDVDLKRPPDRSADELRAALAGNSVAAWLAALPPPTEDYRGLQRALARYRVLAEAGGWDELPAGPTLEPEQSAPIVPALKRRLFAEGDLAVVDGEQAYDAQTVAAVKRFQARHGLNPDGRIGRATIYEMNVSAERRVDQIVANLDRRRAFGRVLPPTRVEVNVPGASAVFLENGVPSLTTRVVVGDREHPTPMLASTISAIIVNPPWNVPLSIIRKEILPKVAKDPAYLEKNRLRWVGETGLRLVQDPGPRNSLGRLKFVFPNAFDVYLHDTPSRSFFVRDNRAQSHGCVRVELPVDLAARLLQEDPGWPRQNIEQAIAAGTTVRIGLKRSVPVLLSYWTAFVAQDGSVEFRRDIYGRDARHAAALFSRTLATTSSGAPRSKGVAG